MGGAVLSSTARCGSAAVVPADVLDEVDAPEVTEEDHTAVEAMPKLALAGLWQEACGLLEAMAPSDDREEAVEEDPCARLPF